MLFIKIMEKKMKLTNEQLLDMSQYTFIRMDGAWFISAAKKFGIQTAWEMDIEAWKQISYLLGKRIRKLHIQEPVWPESFLDAMEIFSKMFQREGRSFQIEGDSVIIRASECETQQAIAKAGIADCGIVTIQSYENLVRGLFNDETKVEVTHSKNLNHGADCCEVVITKK